MEPTMPGCCREAGVQSTQESFGLPLYRSSEDDRRESWKGKHKLPSKHPHLLKTHSPCPAYGLQFPFKYVALPWEPAESQLTHSSHHLPAHKNKQTKPNKTPNILSPPLFMVAFPGFPLGQSLGPRDMSALSLGSWGLHLSLFMCARHKTCPDFVC